EKIPLEDPNIPLIVKELRKDFEIHIVTRTIATPTQLKNWLELNGIEYDGMHRFVRKSEKIKSGVDIIIDDSHEVAEAFAKNGKSAIIYRQPWNMDHNPINNISVARSWSEIPLLVR